VGIRRSALCKECHTEINMNDRRQFLDLIQSNIDKFGYHVTIVNSKIEPRYAYTIGLNSSFKFELIFAGGIYYFQEELFQILNGIVEALKLNKNINGIQNIEVGSLGVFSLAKVDLSWSKLMMLGVFDYYKISDINVFQIIPDANHYTLDIPNMSNEWRPAAEPIWQWLTREWDYAVPEDSTVTTNIKALLGDAITEVMRWENDEWEIFAGAGPDVKKKMCG
jgi:hypothetical protein